MLLLQNGKNCEDFCHLFLYIGPPIYRREKGGLAHPSTLPITDLVTGNLFLQLAGKLLLAENAYRYLGMGLPTISVLAPRENSREPYLTSYARQLKATEKPCSRARSP